MITLLLLKKDKSVNIQFIEFLMRRIYKLFISSIDDKKLIGWNVYINDNKLFRSIYRKSISAKEILISGVSNLIYYDFPDKYIITINPVVMLPGFDAKIIDAFKLIEYGTLNKPGYHLFEDVLKSISKNMSYYKQLFIDNPDKWGSDGYLFIWWISY